MMLLSRLLLYKKDTNIGGSPETLLNLNRAAVAAAAGGKSPVVWHFGEKWASERPKGIAQIAGYARDLDEGRSVGRSGDRPPRVLGRRAGRAGGLPLTISHLSRCQA